MELARRGFITGLVAFVAAPAIVRVASLMPVRVMELEVYGRSPAMDALPDFEYIIRTALPAGKWRQINLVNYA